MDHAAVDDGGIEAPGVEQRGDHGRRRRLAVGAGHGNIGFQAHQLGEHLRAPHHRQSEPPGLVELGVAGLDRAGDHDDLRALEVPGGLNVEHARALGLEPLGDLRGFQIRALHRVAKVQQHLRDPRHADAADPREMDRADIDGELRGCVHLEASVHSIVPVLPALQPGPPAARPHRGALPPARPRPWRRHLRHRSEHVRCAPKACRVQVCSPV